MADSQEILTQTHLNNIAILVYFQIRVLSIQKVNGRVQYEFDNTDGQASEIIMNFMNGTLTVEPQALFNAQANVRDMIMDTLRGNGV